MLLPFRSLPCTGGLFSKTRSSCQRSTAHSCTHHRRKWRCSAAASESAAPELEGNRSKIRESRSNIVPKPSGSPSARSDCEGHKTLSQILNKKPPVIRKALLSSAGKARSPGGLDTVLESYSAQPEHDRIPLHGGLPHPSAFPFAQLTVKLTSGCILTIDDPDLV